MSGPLSLLKKILASQARLLPAKDVTPAVLNELDALRRSEPFVFSGMSAKPVVRDKPWLNKPFESQFFSEDPYVAARYMHPRGALGGVGYRPKGIELRELTGEGEAVTRDFRRVRKSPGDYVDTYGVNGDYEEAERMSNLARPDPRAFDVIEMSLPDVQDVYWKMLNVPEQAMTPSLSNIKDIIDPVQYWVPNLRTKGVVLKKKGGGV